VKSSQITNKSKVKPPEYKGSELSSAVNQEVGDQRMKVWLPYALASAVCFFSGNSILATITANIDGLATIFYVSAGAIFCGALHVIVKCIQNRGWHGQNMIVGGKV
jgi:hypothetical protein